MPSLHHHDIIREKPQFRSLLSRVYLPTLCLIPVLAACLILLSILQAERPPRFSSQHDLPRSDPVHCGSSPFEARSRGCHFDILSFAWQAPECYDAELLDEFMRYDNWTFYTKPSVGIAAANHHHNTTENHTTRAEKDNNINVDTNPATTPEPKSQPETVPLATALQGTRTLYVDQRFHLAHCTFTWRQLHRAYALRGYVDSHIDSYAHTLHCQKVLLAPGDMDGMQRVTVVAEVKYPGCRRVW